MLLSSLSLAERYVTVKNDEWLGLETGFLSFEMFLLFFGRCHWVGG